MDEHFTLLKRVRVVEITPQSLLAFIAEKLKVNDICILEIRIGSHYPASLEVFMVSPDFDILREDDNIPLMTIQRVNK